MSSEEENKQTQPVKNLNEMYNAMQRVRADQDHRKSEMTIKYLKEVRRLAKMNKLEDSTDSTTDKFSKMINSKLESVHSTDGSNPSTQENRAKASTTRRNTLLKILSRNQSRPEGFPTQVPDLQPIQKNPSLEEELPNVFSRNSFYVPGLARSESEPQNVITQLAPVEVQQKLCTEELPAPNNNSSILSFTSTTITPIKSSSNTPVAKNPPSNVLPQIIKPTSVSKLSTTKISNVTPKASKEPIRKSIGTASVPRKVASCTKDLTTSTSKVSIDRRRSFSKSPTRNETRGRDESSRKSINGCRSVDAAVYRELQAENEKLKKEIQRKAKEVETIKKEKEVIIKKLKIVESDKMQLEEQNKANILVIKEKELQLKHARDQLMKCKKS
mgnify:CR=1 FL=1